MWPPLCSDGHGSEGASASRPVWKKDVSGKLGLTQMSSVGLWAPVEYWVQEEAGEAVAAEQIAPRCRFQSTPSCCPA